MDDRNNNTASIGLPNNSRIPPEGVPQPQRPQSQSLGHTATALSKTHHDGGRVQTDDAPEMAATHHEISEIQQEDCKVEPHSERPSQTPEMLQLIQQNMAGNSDNQQDPTSHSPPISRSPRRRGRPRLHTSRPRLHTSLPRRRGRPRLYDWPSPPNSPSQLPRGRPPGRSRGRLRGPGRGSSRGSDHSRPRGRPRGRPRMSIQLPALPRPLKPRTEERG
ncbi:hypothetical protein F5Y00DRAFT_37442 [Daldinia vernicosa]|uniref:uncharacterized protein n=1 Tax=Daldinia vernicosa TaxID=114800 RepID=UPI002007E539|nr:uncharacterized protein F5Y00DRAFT_37442 [Daldinia vernicosa]KAI0850401.1 hypothetical protein F5Y00DRAFT_37442 [Daldinia vernicosa]